MSKTAPINITRVVTTSQTVTQTKPNISTLELIGSLNATTGAEEAEKVLTINPR